MQFGDMKKKKKKGKKGGFDLEAFEKELGEGTSTPAEEADAEGDLGDDPFGADDGDEVAGEKKDSVETWHGTDRDYTYQEVSVFPCRGLLLHSWRLKSVASRP